jgi:hypothetical protein
MDVIDMMIENGANDWNRGFVVLMECVGDDVDGGGVVIENGEVADNG